MISSTYFDKDSCMGQVKHMTEVCKNQAHRWETVGIKFPLEVAGTDQC